MVIVWFIGDKSPAEITAKPPAAVLKLTVVWPPDFPDGQVHVEQHARDLPAVAEYVVRSEPKEPVAGKEPALKAKSSV